MLEANFHSLCSALIPRNNQKWKLTLLSQRVVNDPPFKSLRLNYQDGMQDTLFGIESILQPPFVSNTKTKTKTGTEIAISIWC